MGVPEFAASILEKLIAAGENILAVYTRPDKSAGRGLKMRESAVKTVAETHNLQIFQPPNFKTPESVAELSGLMPDFLVVAAYGLILPREVLDIPIIAPVNVHASLLPEYRGAAPIQRAILENWGPEAKTGVSIMRIAPELDAGPVYVKAEVAIGRQTAPELSFELARIGGDLLEWVLPKIAARQLDAVPQNDSLATYAPKLTKEDGIIVWDRPLLAVDAQIRAVNPWPGSRTTFEIGDKNIAVLIRAGEPGEKGENLAPGTIVRDRRGLCVACADGLYRIESLQIAGKRETDGAGFANGLRLKPGVVGKAL